MWPYKLDRCRGEILSRHIIHPDHSDLACSVCNQLLNSPVQLTCECVMCTLCMRYVLGNGMICPVCKKEIRYDVDTGLLFFARKDLYSATSVQSFLTIRANAPKMASVRAQITPGAEAHVPPPPPPISLPYHSLVDFISKRPFMFEWTIHDWSTHEHMSVNRCQYVLKSTKVYISPRRYRINVNVFPCGIENHVSLYVVVHKGKYDNSLSWPMRMKMVVWVANAQVNQVHSMLLESDDSICFAKPESEANCGFGKVDFISRKTLKEDYVINDALTVYCAILT